MPVLPVSKASLGRKSYHTVDLLALHHPYTWPESIPFVVWPNTYCTVAERRIGHPVELWTFVLTHVVPSTLPIRSLSSQILQSPMVSIYRIPLQPEFMSGLEQMYQHWYRDWSRTDVSFRNLFRMGHGVSLSGSDCASPYQVTFSPTLIRLVTWRFRTCFFTKLCMPRYSSAAQSKQS